jgi:putative membrane-bound dehydrogenase-like protein
MKRIFSTFVLGIFLFGIMLAASCSGPKYPGPLTPDQSLQAFQLIEGFEIEVFASEPHVMDPVDIEYDEFGNVYAVEMLDYPYNLEDTNQDGRIDTSVIFKDSLTEATSILPWENGLLVCSAPDIIYLKDTDGDHVADIEEVLFTGFFANNSEAQITNLKYNVDNWIYGSNNGRPGEVSFLRRPDLKEVSVQGTDFRFRLDTEQFEPAAGSTQFGQAIDNWGQRFGTQNTIHLSQIVIPWRYLIRDSTQSTKAPVQNISDHDLEMFQLTPPPYWRAERTARRQKSYDEQNLDRIEWAEDHFTGCSGGTIYNGHLFPKSYHGSVFTGEVAGNLIHRDQLVQGNGPLFTAKRPASELDREFLATTDSWFRPANLEVAPDGSLLVVDMYRQHIETPLSIPEDLKEDMDFYRGDDMGRIYRIIPEGYSENSEVIFPGELSSQQLIPLLEHPHGWWRLTAQRLLVERGDTSVLDQVVKLFSQSESPLTRLHALFVTEALGGMSSSLSVKAMQDAHPQLRIRGLQFAEAYPELIDYVIRLMEDPDIKVRFQAALSIGTFKKKEATQALKALQSKFGNDPWFVKAIEAAQAVKY